MRERFGKDKGRNIMREDVGRRREGFGKDKERNIMREV